METIVSPDQLKQLMQEVFGTRVEVVDQIILKQDHDYLVLLLKLQHPSLRIVVKIAGPEAPLASTFDRTAMFHRLVVTHTDIPMAEIIAVNMSTQTWPWRYLIESHIPGQAWVVVHHKMSHEELSDAYQQLGRAVAQLHAIRFPGYGEVANDGTVQGDEPYLTAFIGRACRSIRSLYLRDLFLSVVDQHSQLFKHLRSPCLCHEDLHGYNILFHHQNGKWDLAAILDFDKAWAGHQEIDLSRMEIWKGMTSQEFWQAYQTIHSLDATYEERRPIYQLLWCFEYARNTPEHIGDTGRLCAELGLPSISSFD